MGLDQYFFVKANNSEGEEKDVCIATFRKHPNLHGFFARRWLAQNPDKKEDDFNGEQYVITEEDLTTLLKANQDKDLTEGHGDTHGFFFGERAEEDYHYQVVDVVLKVHQMLEDKFTVVYDSWW